MQASSKSRSFKPLLFSLLCLIIVLGFAFDSYNSRRAHQNANNLRRDQAATSKPESPARSLGVPSVTQPPSRGGNEQRPQKPPLRFDPNADSTLVVVLGGFHPQKKPLEKKPAYPVDPATDRAPRAPARTEIPLRRRQRKAPSPSNNKPDLPSNQTIRETSEEIYTVGNGESLSQIAEKFLGSAIRWKEIAQFNGIDKPHLLREGTRLRIPPQTRPTPRVPAKVRGRECKVKPSDTLTKIAARELGDANRWREIAKLNKIDNPRQIREGQHLLLP